jgi:hypothetical protein
MTGMSTYFENAIGNAIRSSAGAASLYRAVGRVVT